MQAAFGPDQVDVSGSLRGLRADLRRAGQKGHVFHFCPDCGSQVFYTEPTEPDLIVVSVGSFADPSFPPPDRVGLRLPTASVDRLPDSIGDDPALRGSVQSPVLKRAGTRRPPTAAAR